LLSINCRHLPGIAFFKCVELRLIVFQFRPGARSRTKGGRSGSGKVEADLAPALNPSNCLFHALPMIRRAAHNHVANIRRKVLTSPRGIGILAKLLDHSLGVRFNERSNFGAAAEAGVHASQIEVDRTAPDEAWLAGEKVPWLRRSPHLHFESRKNNVNGHLAAIELSNLADARARSRGQDRLCTKERA